MSRRRFVAVVCVAVALALIPAVVVALGFAAMQSHVEALEQQVERQGDTLQSYGLPRDGTDGATGTTGPQGPQGPRGPQGVPGDDGVSIRGQAGQPGADGVEGAPGINGADGVDGAVGAPGPAGPQGDPGPAGAQGPQGEVGPQGTPGAAPVGIQVPDGQGGWCTATDGDGDGVYQCPDV